MKIFRPNLTWKIDLFHEIRIAIIESFNLLNVNDLRYAYIQIFE